MFIDGNLVAQYDNYVAAQLGGGFSYNSKNTWGAHWQAPGVYTLKYTGEISNYRVIKKSSMTQNNNTQYAVPTISPADTTINNYGITDSGAYCVCILFASATALTVLGNQTGLAPTIRNGSSTGGSTGGGITITIAPLVIANSPAGRFVTGGGDFTIEFLLRLTSLPTTNVTFFGIPPNTATNGPYGLVIRKYLNNNLVFQMNGQEGSMGIERILASHADVAVNIWYNVVVSRRRGVISTMFGQSGAGRWPARVGSENVVPIPTPTANYKIGGRADGLESFSGYISNFRFLRGKGLLVRHIDDLANYSNPNVNPIDYDLMQNLALPSSYNSGGGYPAWEFPTEPLTNTGSETVLLALKSSTYLDKSSYNNTLTTTSPTSSMTVKPIPFSSPNFPGAEGYSFEVSLTTTNLPITIPLYWTVKHITTSAGEFPNVSGSVTRETETRSKFFFSGGSTDFAVDSANPETYQLEIRYGSITGTVLITSSILNLWDTSFPAT